MQQSVYIADLGKRFQLPQDAPVLKADGTQLVPLNFGLALLTHLRFHNPALDPALPTRGAPKIRLVEHARF